MLKYRALSLTLSLLLAGGVIVMPRVALSTATDEEAAADTQAETAGDAATAPQDATSAQPSAPRKKGNAFARALSAPFRALGRLFGGGRKSSDTAAQKRAPQPEQVKAAEVRPAPEAGQRAKAKESAKAEKRSPAKGAAAPEAGSPVAAAVEQSVVPVIRPDEQPRAATHPKMWIPVIEGIGKDPLTQGRALLEHGYLREAIAELSAAASGTQDLAEANNLLGLAYDRLGDHRQAAEAYQRALTVASKDPVLLANLGYSLYLSNDFTGAIKRLRQAAQLAPHLVVVHNNLGIVHARLGKYDDAFRSFARATNAYDAHLKLAGILEFEQREKQAIKHYEAALRLQPGATAVLERLVALYERTGDRTKADTARRTLGQPKNEQRTTTGGG